MNYMCEYTSSIANNIISSGFQVAWIARIDASEIT